MSVKSALRVAWHRGRRLARALRGQDLWWGPQVRTSKVRMGSVYGGWWILPSLLSRESIVYSVGVGDDVTFDLAMIDRFGMDVHAFDPTPRCVEWVERQALPPQFRFHPLGLADFDGTARFSMPSDDPTWNAYEMDGDPAKSKGFVECEVRRLGTLMRDLGHDRIDMLKMDIEGAEYAAIKDLVAGSARPPQLLIEFHYWYEPKERVRQMNEAIESILGAGYVIFARSATGTDFSFVLKEALSRA